MADKRCSKCGEVKDVGEFRLDNRNKSGLKSQCKECENKAAKEYRLNNPDKYKESKHKYNNSEKGKLKNKEWKDNNPDKVKAKKDKYLSNPQNKQKHLDTKKKYREANKELITEYNKRYYEEHLDSELIRAKKYRAENKDVIRVKNREYVKNRLAVDEFERFKYNIRRTVYKSFKRLGYTKNSKTYNILGCSWEFFKGYIEAQFTDGMTWQNYGYDGWHYDHIIPLATANTEEDVLKLCYYTNLRPMWGIDNIMKSDKIVEGIQLKFI